MTIQQQRDDDRLLEFLHELRSLMKHFSNMCDQVALKTQSIVPPPCPSPTSQSFPITPTYRLLPSQKRGRKKPLKQQKSIHTGVPSNHRRPPADQPTSTTNLESNRLNLPNAPSSTNVAPPHLWESLVFTACGAREIKNRVLFGFS
jgi:hypothetical protein